MAGWCMTCYATDERLLGALSRRLRSMKVAILLATSRDASSGEDTRRAIVRVRSASQLQSSTMRLAAWLRHLYIK